MHARLRSVCVLVAVAAISLPAAGTEDLVAVGARASECPDGIVERDPIVIEADTDVTASNGITGNSGDAYAISCWSIRVGPGDAGISIGGSPSFRVTKRIVIRDVLITGENATPGGDCGGSCGVYLRDVSAGIEHVTVQDLDVGILTQSVRNLTLTGNRMERNRTGLQDVSSPDVAILGNVGIDNSQACIVRHVGGSVAETHPVVEGNECRGGSGAGFELRGAGLVVTGNTAEDIDGTGFSINSGSPAVVARDNVARRNGTGIALGSKATIQGNLIERNTDAGIDITFSADSVIRDNTIVGNGGAGIFSFFQWPFAVGSRTRIEGNRIGGSPYGIVLSHGTNSAVVVGTEWTDGQQSIMRGEDVNTIVDAGSDRRGIPGSPVRFHDYIATATLTGQPLDALAPAGVVLEVRWDFGDGSGLVMSPDPLQGHALPPPVSHVYGSPGPYVATMTVRLLDSRGQEQVLADTTQVEIWEG